MEIIVNMDNLHKIIEESAKINTAKAIEMAIQEVARTKVDEVLDGKIEEIVNVSIGKYVNEYLSTAKIRIGGGWGSDIVEEYTAEEYLRKQIKEVFDNQKFKTKYRNRWGNWEEKEVTFQEYFQGYFSAEDIVKPYIDKMAKEIKENVNNKVRTVFDEAMKNTLAENVFAIVSASDTYKSISNSLKMLGE